MAIDPLVNQLKSLFPGWTNLDSKDTTSKDTGNEKLLLAIRVFEEGPKKGNSFLGWDDDDEKETVAPNINRVSALSIPKELSKKQRILCISSTEVIFIIIIIIMITLYLSFFIIFLFFSPHISQISFHFISFVTNFSYLI